MPLNTLPFTVKVLSESAVIPVKVSFTESTALHNKIDFPYSSNSVTGENLSGGKFGDDELFSGEMYGKGEFGGIARFKNR